MQCIVVDEFFRAVDALMDSEKAPRDYGTGHLLYHSEVNLLDAICRYPKSNAIELADKMGVTRAAITQMGTRLEEKGFLTRSAKAGNRKEKLYCLTALGESLREAHEEYHKQANEKMCKYIRGLTDQDSEIILRFLGNIIESIPVSRHDCPNKNGCRAIYKEAERYVGTKKCIL